jgi:hypothetical protein
MLEEARQAFMVSEVMRPIHAYQRMFNRLAAQIDVEEAQAAFLMLRLDLDRLMKRNELAGRVMHVLRDSLRWDGLCYRSPSAHRVQSLTPGLAHGE